VPLQQYCDSVTLIFAFVCMCICIPGRFLKIPDSASSVYHFISGQLHLPYTDPVPSPFNASISPFRHIQYLQLLYLSDSFFVQSLCLLSFTNAGPAQQNH